MKFLPSHRPSRPKPGEPIVALDVGTSKIACFIAAAPGATQDELRTVRPHGVGHQSSAGVRQGAIVDLDATEAAIRTAVERAERMSGETVRHVHVAYSGARLLSRVVGVEVDIGSHRVTDEDVRGAMSHGAAALIPEGGEFLHLGATAFEVDEDVHVRDPRGMYSEKLNVRMHSVAAPSAPLKNLRICIERCHLKPVEFIASAYASALAVLVDDEAELGVTCIDMGAGATRFSVVADGAPVYCDAVPVGGQHVTNDIAQGLSTSVAESERLKTLRGSALSGLADEREFLDVPRLDGANVRDRAPRAELSNIVRSRLEETFELVRDRLRNSGADGAAGRRVVLTGGASQISGCRETAVRVLGRQVRLGRPLHLAAAEAVTGPAFSSCAGVLEYAVYGPQWKSYEVGAAALASGGGAFGERFLGERFKAKSPIDRAGRWFRERF